MAQEIFVHARRVAGSAEAMIIAGPIHSGPKSVLDREVLVTLSPDMIAKIIRLASEESEDQE